MVTFSNHSKNCRKQATNININIIKITIIYHKRIEFFAQNGVGDGVGMVFGSGSTARTCGITARGGGGG